MANKNQDQGQVMTILYPEHSYRIEMAKMYLFAVIVVIFVEFTYGREDLYIYEYNMNYMESGRSLTGEILHTEFSNTWIQCLLISRFVSFFSSYLLLIPLTLFDRDTGACSKSHKL